MDQKPFSFSHSAFSILLKKKIHNYHKISASSFKNSRLPWEYLLINNWICSPVDQACQRKLAEEALVWDCEMAGFTLCLTLADDSDMVQVPPLLVHLCLDCSTVRWPLPKVNGPSQIQESELLYCLTPSEMPIIFSRAGSHTQLTVISSSNIKTGYIKICKIHTFSNKS